MPFDDDAADDVTGFRPPPHPDDRLWRHPSEVYAAEPAMPLRTHGRIWPWSIAALGTAGVMLAGAGTLVLGVRERADDDTARDRQHAAVTPFDSLPRPRIGEQRLTHRSREGVTDLAEIARLSDDLAPSLVRIEGATATGSGVVLGDDGMVLTSADLVDGLVQITVTLHDGHRVAGEVKGTDALTGIAVVDVPAVPEPPTGATPSDPSDVRAGEGVLAMGVGIEGGRPATTLGPLSTGHRRLERTGQPAVDGLLHVDVPAQLEARGGPLVDQHGTVIGITIWTDESATYATPIDVATEVAGDILTTGRPRHAWLGILGRDAGEEASPTIDTAEDDGDTGTEAMEQIMGAVGDDARAEQAGVLVVTVVPSGPAASLLRPGDVISEIDGQPVAGMADLADALGVLDPGDSVVLTVERDAGTTVDVTLAERPADP